MMGDLIVVTVMFGLMVMLWNSGPIGIALVVFVFGVMAGAEVMH